MLTVFKCPCYSVDLTHVYTEVFLIYFDIYCSSFIIISQTPIFCIWRI